MAVSASHRVAALPLVSEAALTSGTLEIRGSDDARALCLRSATGEVTCAAPSPRAGPPGVPETRTAGLVLEGTWYVVAAGPVPAEMSVAPALSEPATGHGAGVDGPPIPTETATVGPWAFTLARPDELADILVLFGGSGSSVSPPG